jgi:hypothetical protein
VNDAAAIPTSTPIFSAMAMQLGYDTVDIIRHCPTLPDVDQLSKIKMAATETGNGNNY